MGQAYKTVGTAIFILALAAAAWRLGGDAPESAVAGAALQEQETAADTAPGAEALQETPADTAAPVSAVDTRADSVPEQTAEEAIVAHETAGRGPEQPIPFNHRFHVQQLQVDCMYCHIGTEKSVSGVVPPLEVCMGCHRVAGAGLEPVEELKDYWERGESIPWEWVYKLPEFVQFDHQPHIRNEISCQRCHGPVEEMDRVYQATSLTMGWCLDCHRSEPLETDVATDYVLTRRGDEPTLEAPYARQHESLYPTTIDVQYGRWRAPIDCLTCHY